jgi:alkaline phosphatase
MIEEQIDFNRAVEAVVDWVQKNSNWGETMVIVTADHETGYVWGPGSNPSFEPIINNRAGVMPGMQFYGDIGGFNWHSNSLVPLFAKGDAARLFRPYAKKTDLVRGPYIDNTDIFKIMQDCFK